MIQNFTDRCLWIPRNQGTFLCLPCALLFVFSYCFAYFLHVSFLFPILPLPVSTMSQLKFLMRTSQPFGVWIPADIPIHPKIHSVDTGDGDNSVFLSIFFLLGWGGWRRQKRGYPYKNCVSKMNHVDAMSPVPWCMTHRPSLSLPCSFPDLFNPIFSPTCSKQLGGLSSAWKYEHGGACARARLQAVPRKGFVDVRSFKKPSAQMGF